MRTQSIAIAVAIAAAAATLAGASDHGRGERDEHEEHEGGGDARLPTASAADPGARALYRKECGACHLDFPPGLLPAESHRRTLAGLERHFGQNAELDPAVSARLERWLVENAADAGTRGRSGKLLASLGGAAPLRITELPSFQRKHRKLGADVVARPAVKSLANCAACHRGAADWDFDDDRVKIPAATP
jgi:diheme cytochrome c